MVYIDSNQIKKLKELDKATGTVTVTEFNAEQEYVKGVFNLGIGCSTCQANPVVEYEFMNSAFKVSY